MLKPKALEDTKVKELIEVNFNRQYNFKDKCCNKHIVMAIKQTLVSFYFLHTLLPQ